MVCAFACHVYANQRAYVCLTAYKFVNYIPDITLVPVVRILNHNNNLIERNPCLHGGFLLGLFDLRRWENHGTLRVASTDFFEFQLNFSASASWCPLPS